MSNNVQTLIKLINQTLKNNELEEKMNGRGKDEVGR